MRSIHVSAVAGVSALLLLAGAVALAGDRGAGASRASAHRPAAATRPDVRQRAPRPERPERPDRATVVERTDTGMTRTTTVTNGEGETRTSTTTVVHDKESGTHSVDVERTGFDGRASSVSRETQRTEDGFDRSLEVTRPDGKTMTRETSVSRDEDGNRVVEGTRTRPEKKPDAPDEDEAD